MFKFNGRSNAVTLNDQEREELNPLLEDVQTRYNTTFTSTKGAFVWMLKHLQANEINTNPETDQQKSNDIDPISVNSDELEALKESVIALENKNSDLEIKKEDLQSKISEQLSEIETLKAAEPQTVEVEVPVPVELTENQVLLNLNGSQMAITKLIAARRYANKMDAEQNTVEKQIISLAFDKQTVFNWAGNYRTFVELKDFK